VGALKSTRYYCKGKERVFTPMRGLCGPNLGKDEDVVSR